MSTFPAIPRNKSGSIDKLLKDKRQTNDGQELRTALGKLGIDRSLLIILF